MYSDIHTSDTARDGFLRLFAALRPTPTAARELGGHVARTARAYDGVRAIPTENLHVTFAWLGDVREADVPVIATALDAAASTLRDPVACTVGEPVVLGAGRVHAAHVALAHFSELNAARAQFVEAVELLAPHIDRRPWVPHLSLVRSEGRGALTEEFRTNVAAPPAVEWVSPELVLTASVGTPLGSQHFAIHGAQFGVEPGSGSSSSSFEADAL